MVLEDIKEAQKEIDSSADFCHYFWSTAAGKLPFLILIGSCTAIPAAMFFIGVRYSGQCPAEPLLPLYLSVSGTVGLLIMMGVMWNLCRIRKHEIEGTSGGDSDNDMTSPQTCCAVAFMLIIFLLGWYIAANQWVFELRTFIEFEETFWNARFYCHPVVYYTSLTVIIGFYVLLAVLVLLLVLLAVCYTYLKRQETD